MGPLVMCRRQMVQRTTRGEHMGPVLRISDISVVDIFSSSESIFQPCVGKKFKLKIAICGGLVLTREFHIDCSAAC